MTRAKATRFIPVAIWDDVPAFANEDEEHEFWSTHSFGEGVLKHMQRVPLEGDDERPPARAETVRPRRRK